MARLTLNISRDPHRLLEHAADGFLRPPTDGRPFPSPAYYLVLRQGGLRDDLLALAAARGVPGWFDPPIALIQELPTLLADLDRPAVGDFERVVLVGRALRESAGPAFGRIRDVTAYADAVDRWIGELLGEGVGPGELGAALETAGPRDGFARGRDAELLRTFTHYLAALDEAGLRDGRARLIDCAAAIEAHPDDVAERLGGRREIRLVGLSDPRGGWPRLLRALHACSSLDHVHVYAAERAEFLTSIADDVVDLDTSPHFTSAVFGGATEETAGAGTIRPHITLLSAPDLPREVEEITTRVRRLIDSGIAPHRIAVVSRSARPYTAHMMRALERVGVPASARVRHALPEVPAIRALLALFRVAAEGWERLGLVELAETPYFRARLDAGVLNHIGYQRRLQGLEQWRDAIARLHRTALAREKRLEEDPDDEEARRNPLPSSARIEQALANFDAFARHAHTLDRARPIADWLEWLAAFVEDDEWRLQRTMYDVPGDGLDTDRLGTVRIDVVAWKAMREIIGEWSTAERRWGGTAPIDVAGFEARLRSTLSGDAALFTPARRGVQLLEGLAAAFRSFDHVFLVGLDAARVPLRAPRSPLLDEHERVALRTAGLGIDTRQQWEEREQALFTNMLATAATSLTLSCPRYDETGAELLPSAFLEEVEHAFALDYEVIASSRAFTPDMPLVADATALELAHHAAHAERGRAADPTSPWNGRIEEEAVLHWLAAEMGESKVWSPTQIEAYAKCPWSYFSGRLLRLEQFEDPDLDIDAMTRGSILHDALRRFYEAARARVGGPVHLRGIDLDWARPLAEQAITDAIEDARGRVWVGHPALEQQKLAELTRMLVAYIEWEAEDNDDAATNARKKVSRYVKTDVDEHEVAFNDIELEVEGMKIRFRGFIDRVEVGNDPRFPSEHFVAAVDYKSSKWSTPAGGDKKGWDDAVVLQVPLYAYALTQLRPGSVPARVEYRSIRSRERVHVLALHSYTKTHGLEKDDDEHMKYEDALRDAARQVAAARAGQFRPLPPPSCNCPPFCHAYDICRIPGGPRTNR